MKLLIFSPYYPPHIGGLESHADEFNKYLSQKGIDIVVFTPRLPEDAPEEETKYGRVKIIRFPAFEIVSNYPLPKLWVPKFWKLFYGLFKQKYDIVISRTRFFNTSLLALLYAKIKGVKWVHIEHGSDYVKLTSKVKTKLAKIYDCTFGFLIFKYSDINISISKAVNIFVEKFDKRKSPIIYRGLDFLSIDKIEPNFEFKKQYANKIILTFAGRLFKWKGVEDSIRAIKNLPEDIKDKIVFFIIGDGEDFYRLKRLIDTDKDPIFMLGNRTRKEVISILKIADIYIHSSHKGGGLSTSLLEAMYCRCAVIATPNEGADEVIEDNFNEILMKDNSFKNDLEKIINSAEKRKKYSEIAKYTISKKFNWTKSIESYLNIFKKNDQ